MHERPLGKGTTSSQQQVKGIQVGPNTQCLHWHSDRDVVAIKFKCCQSFYACFECHAKTTNHPPQVWPRKEFQEEKGVVLCGKCGQLYSIQEYLECGNQCVSCGCLYNPGCRLHYHLYFEAYEKDQD